MYDKSIELLNTAIADEIAAIHQYMYFHFRLDDLGYAPLANLLKMTAIEEMQHAEMIAERILFLGGEVADSGTKKLFEELVAAEEGHWDQFDRQSEHVQRFGEQYLALQGFQGDSGEEPAQ
jgi:bacterioferritin